MALTDPVDTGRRAGPLVAFILVLLLFAAAVTVLILAILDWSGATKPASADAAVAAARTEALNIMTLDYRTAKRDLQRVLDGSIGQMHDQYSKSATSLISTATSGQSVSTGTVLSNGLSYPKNQPSLKGNKAEVLVAGDATVSFAKTKTSKASTLRVRYRFIFEMQKERGGWKSAQLNFAGLPSYSQVSS